MRSIRKEGIILSEIELAFQNQGVLNPKIEDWKTLKI